MEGHDSRAIANFFVARAEKEGYKLTILSLLKFVYFAHGWMLGHTGKPLIKHFVEVWKHGPVVPEVYDAFRSQGVVIKEPAKNLFRKVFTTKLSVYERKLLKNVFSEYSQLDYFELSSITRGDNTPWAKNKYKKNYYGKIPNKEIEIYYKKLVEKTNRI